MGSLRSAACEPAIETDVMVGGRDGTEIEVGEQGQHKGEEKAQNEYDVRSRHEDTW